MDAGSRSTIWLSAIAVGAFQVVGSFGAADNQPERRAIDAVAVALLLLGPLALAWRDRRPHVTAAVALTASAVYIGGGYPYGPVFVSVIVALYTCVQGGYRRTTWLLAGAGYAGYLVATAVDDRADVGLVHLSLVAGWLCLVLAVSEVVRIRRDQQADRTAAAADDERRRRDEQRLLLAQELHDVLAHNISLINVQAGVALHLLDEQPEQARPALATIKAASRDALHELRTALDLLRRGPDDAVAPRTPAPRLADLEALVATLRTSGLDVTVDEAGPPPPLPAAVELAAHRIVQEALTNVTRHAHAQHVTVRIRYDDGVRLEVVDDGAATTGARAAPTPGNGILGMRERAAALGGTVEVGPAPGGRGFRVAAHLPARATAP